eukprot:SAG31_NODE_4236_length_3427_cov_24.184574_1_plen_33_part_00
MRENDVKLDAEICGGGVPNTFWRWILEGESAL